jgi:urease accessory protein
MNTLLLLLLDSRAPAGAHNHSAGMEAAVGTGLVTGLADLETFCRARLATSGRVAAAFAAAACHLQDQYPERLDTEAAARPHDGAAGPHATEQPAAEPGGTRQRSLPDSGRTTCAAEHSVRARSRSEEWALLDAELDERTP